MLRADVHTIAQVTDGRVIVGADDTSVNGVAIDSREVTPGCAFVALSGERTDGHDHLGQALGAGARLLIVTRDPERIPASISDAEHAGAAVIRVDSGEAALEALASWHRGRLLASVVGITGSSGKTTTKDFLMAALRASRRVVATRGNRNNELGVPLTIMDAGADTDVLVVEMGMRGPGQISALTRIARPLIGLVTNVGTSHIEILGSQDAVADAKSELVESIPADGAVFLNGDDAYSPVLAQRAVAPVTFYGLSSECPVRAESIAVDDDSRASFRLVTPQGSIDVTLPVPGRHNVYNALAAAAVALRLAVDLPSVAAGLSAAEFSGMRMESFVTAAGVTVVNDAYNANPSSMRAAVETLGEMRTTGKRIAVLGDMAELGSLTELAHFGIGEGVAKSGIEELVTVGPRAEHIAAGARAEGMSPDSIRPCATADEASEVLDDLVVSGDVVLVKASRVMGLERIVERIVNPRVG